MTLQHEIESQREGTVPGAPAIEAIVVSKIEVPTPRCACGAEVDPDLIAIRLLFPSLSPDLCTKCYELAAREDEARNQRDQENAEHRHRLALLDQTIPPKILATDLSHPTFNKALFIAVQGWKPESGRWLVIHGPPGCCKTRIAGTVAKRLILEGRHVTWTTAGKFQEAVEELNTFGKGDASRRAATIEKLRRWKEAKILVFDDLGKNTWFPTLEAKFFELIDHRETHYLPTIITSNTSLPQLVAEMSEKVGGPAIGRIMDAAKNWTLEAKPVRS